MITTDFNPLSASPALSSASRGAEGFYDVNITGPHAVRSTGLRVRMLTDLYKAIHGDDMSLSVKSYEAATAAMQLAFEDGRKSAPPFDGEQVRELQRMNESLATKLLSEQAVSRRRQEEIEKLSSLPSSTHLKTQITNLEKDVAYVTAHYHEVAALLQTARQELKIGAGSEYARLAYDHHALKSRLDIAERNAADYGQRAADFGVALVRIKEQCEGFCNRITVLDIARQALAKHTNLV